MDVGGAPHTGGTMGNKEAATAVLVSREGVLPDMPCSKEVPESLLTGPMAPRLGERECGVLLVRMDKVCKSLDESSAVVGWVEECSSEDGLRTEKVTSSVRALLAGQRSRCLRTIDGLHALAEGIRGSTWTPKGVSSRLAMATGAVKKAEDGTLEVADGVQVGIIARALSTYSRLRGIVCDDDTFAQLQKAHDEARVRATPIASSSESPIAHLVAAAAAEECTSARSIVDEKMALVKPSNAGTAVTIVSDPVRAVELMDTERTQCLVRVLRRQGSTDAARQSVSIASKKKPPSSHVEPRGNAENRRKRRKK